MRGLTLTTLLLTLPGCSIDNPRFGVDTTGSGGADTAAASTALTGEAVTGTPDPTEAMSPSTGTTTSEPGTATSEPGTTQASDPVDSSSTGLEPLPVCSLINDAFAPYLLMNGEPAAPCPEPEIFLKGKLAVGDPLLFALDADCGAASEDVYTLGTGMALPPQAISGCLKLQLKLVDTAEGCKINQINVYDPAVVPAKNYLLAAFSAPSDGLLFQPQAANKSYCGCADPVLEGPNCCDGLDPGELTLQPTMDANVTVEQFGHESVLASNGQPFEFYNLQSWVGPECMIGPEAGQHIDWIAVAKP